MAADSRIVATVPPKDNLPTAQAEPMSVMNLLARRETIQRVIDEVMLEDVHYGVIPGTGNRLSLLKEGAEVLLSTFHIAVEPIVMDLSTPQEVRFRVECRGTVNGLFVGSGIGICSSNEEKYRWRKAKSLREYEAAEPNHRKIKFTSSGEEQVVRASPYDQIQTVMAMAEKRAKVDLAKGALAASECLKRKRPNKWQDEAARKRNGQGGNPAPQGSTPPGKTQTSGTPPDRASAASPGAVAKEAPPAKQEGPVLIDEEHVERICKILDNTGIPDSLFLSAFEIGTVKELEASRFEAALGWLDRNSP